MKAVVQRVKKASVEIDHLVHSKIDMGLLTLVGFEEGDSPEQVKKLVEKILNLRVFEDSEGKMSLSLRDIEGEHLVVSQFTLAADTSKERRPSFEKSMSPKKARVYYESFLQESKSYVPTESGVFGASMQVQLVNDGPVTILLDI